MALAFRCCRRPRESWPTTTRATRMWAARFSSRYSEKDFQAMSRIGKRPVTIPSGVTASVEGQTVKMKGPKGQLQFVVHDDVEEARQERGHGEPAVRHQPRDG